MKICPFLFILVCLIPIKAMEEKCYKPIISEPKGLLILPPGILSGYKLESIRNGLIANYNKTQAAKDATILLDELLHQDTFLSAVLCSEDKHEDFASKKFQSWYLQVNRAMAMLFINENRFEEAEIIFTKINERIDLGKLNDIEQEEYSEYLEVWGRYTLNKFKESDIKERMAIQNILN
jgi:hypothetical protein